MKVQKDISDTTNQMTAARKMGISDRTLRRWCGQGVVPFTKVNQTVRIPNAYIEAFTKGQPWPR